MKPKTKLQKKVMKLKEKLQPLTDRQQQGAQENCFAKYFVRVRNRNYCLECGEKFMPGKAALADTVGPVTCPGCKQHLKSMPWEGPQRDNAYWGIITTREGFQVVRIIRVSKYMKRQKPASYYHEEVMQHWVRPDGKTTSLVAYAQGMSYYYDAWVSSSELEPRTPSPAHYHRCGLVPGWIAPYQRVLPVIRRNGYVGQTYGKTPHRLFSAILKNPQAETLLKANQISLLKHSIGNAGVIDTRWPQIKIAIRHGYQVTDATSWLDNLRMAEELGKDIHNPKYVCPENLKEAHDRHMDKVQKMRESEAFERRKQQMAEENIEYQKRIAPFLNLHFKDGDLEIVPLKDVEEFIIEADKLHHCIFSSNYHQREDSLVLSARISGEPVETVEVDLKRMKVAQARGLQNQPTEHHDWIVETVRRNMHKIAKRLNKAAA